MHSKIIIPTALFGVFPTKNELNTIYSCRDQTIYFTDLSNANGGTALFSYVWDFGDASPTNYSTLPNPTHSYSSDGDYTVTLTVTNSCGCSSVYTNNVIVKDIGFDIACPGVVCDGQNATYTLPFDGQESCNGNYAWSTSGGTITAIDPQNGAVSVSWNHSDASGFGTLTFNPVHCEGHCVFLTSIHVPIIQTHGTIVGQTSMCIGEQVRFKLPQWPTTDFHWEIEGNAAGNIAHLITTDQRNEVIIEPYISGTFVLKATYFNTLLHCGGSASITIEVRSPESIQGATTFCQNALGNFETANGNSVHWILSTASGVSIDEVADSTTYSYQFTTQGDFQLAIENPALCGGQNIAIKVYANPNPVPLGAISGEQSVCPFQTYAYAISNPDTNLNYRWEVTNGTLLSPPVGTQASIKFNDNAAYEVRVYAESKEPLICKSAPTIYPVLRKTLPAFIAAPATSICANSEETYKVDTIGTTALYTEAESYVWSISPSTAGSITQGQGTTAIKVLWNNSDSQVTATLSLQLKNVPYNP